MSAGFSRTGVVMVLTAAAVAVPCTAWYVVGAQETARQAAEIREAPMRQVQESGRQLALQMAVRLEALRELEASRPYFHYQHRYHDPQTGCACAAFRLSPLAAGQIDPLIHSYFQLDSAAQVTIPTLALDPGVQEEGEWVRSQKAIQGALQDGVPALTAALASTPDRDEVPLFRRVHDQESGPASEAPPDDASYAADEHGPAEPAVLSVGPFRWRTVALDGEARLVALREVITTEDELTQGWVISHRALEEPLHQAAYRPVLLSGSSADLVTAVVPIPGAAWHIRLDASEAVAAALLQAREVESSFRRLFLGGATAAVLAGISVVVLIFQSERAGRQRARFAAAAAHELRTPLAGLRLHGEMLADGLGDPARVRDYAARMADESERLGRVVANVLNYTRLEQGSLQLQARPGDLASAVRRSADQLRPAVEAAGGRLDLEIAESLPQVSFDADAVHHIVQNLLDNAEKFSRQAADRTIHLGLCTATDGLKLSVQDHGPGVAPAGWSRLFKPFTRGNGRDDPAGLGLGLTLVRALAGAHGGTVRCLPVAGGGSMFEVIFPL